MATDVFKEVIIISEEYLGMEAGHFIDRLSTYHLNKKSSDLTAKDIPELARWIKVSMGLLTEDRSLVDKYVKKIMKLTR